jgi:hypothetical protein
VEWPVGPRIRPQGDGVTIEDQHVDRKSLRIIQGKAADWEEIAKDCVCFANGAGGRLLIASPNTVEAE